ncbi:MAG: PilZ domain-containing protein [Candidatus Acidiferrum sp.]
MATERRASPRYPFFAVAELTESGTGARMNARTSDLGPNGCFLGTLNPLPPGTIISIQITHQGKVFSAGGVVAHSHPNTGMGVKFIALESGCGALLENWIQEAALV